jgi:hypothetical protein
LAASERSLPLATKRCTGVDGISWCRLDNIEPARRWTVKRGFARRSFAGFSGVIEVDSNDLANSHTAVACWYTF